MSVTRVTVQNSYSIEERWTADSREEILALYSDMVVRYPPDGYGTAIYDVKRDINDKLWHATFSRYSSCD